MYATLTIPPGAELPAPRSTPTVRVRSADELRTALRQARGQALTLDGSGMDRVLRVDAARGLLEVQAAATWCELSRQLAPLGMSLDAFAQTPGLPAAVGAAVSAAAPGPDGLPVCAHVIAATLVMPDGELKRADRQSNRELLARTLGGQGVIGVLYSVTLSIESLRQSAAGAEAPVDLGIPEAGQAAPAACALTCLLPPETLEAFLGDVRALFCERQLALLGISVRRLRADGSCHLNWATREWAGVDIRFGVKSTLGASVSAAEVRRALLAAALARGGSFPISDARDASRGQLEACYPMLKDFLAEKRRGDPAERLQNGWYRRVTATVRGETCESRWAKG